MTKIWLNQLEYLFDLVKSSPKKPSLFELTKSIVSGSRIKIFHQTKLEHMDKLGII